MTGYHLSQSFHNRAFSNAGLSNEHRIVLLSPCKYLRYACYLVLTSHHGVKHSLSGSVGKVDAEVVEQRCL